MPVVSDDIIIKETVDEKIDRLEAVMQSYEAVDCPLKHRFTDGMYIREIFMPAGSLITSLKHITNHPFFVLQGKVTVYSDVDGEMFIEAPYIGITMPDTRRVLFIHEDTIWATCHVTTVKPDTDSDEDVKISVDKICDIIIDKRVNNILGGVIKNNVLIKTIESY